MNWIQKNFKSVIYIAFLVPILTVAFVSISHVTKWYGISNPFSWAIYLSIAIEVAAMSSISAASVKIKGGVWLVFIIVSLVQFIGNIFFCYKETDITTQDFKSWVELTQPVFEMLGSDVKDIVAQRRWLALLEGGLLPIISLTSLHFFIKYEEKKEITTPAPEINTPAQPISTPATEPIETNPIPESLVIDMTQSNEEKRRWSI